MALSTALYTHTPSHTFTHPNPKTLTLTLTLVCLNHKAMKTLKHISVQEAQKRFVARLQKLEAFGMAFYSAEVLTSTLYTPLPSPYPPTLPPPPPSHWCFPISLQYEECSGYLGIGPDTICCIEREGMEVLCMFQCMCYKDRCIVSSQSLHFHSADIQPVGQI